MLNESRSLTLISDGEQTLFFPLIFVYASKFARIYENNFRVHCSGCSLKSNRKISVVKLKNGL